MSPTNPTTAMRADSANANTSADTSAESASPSTRQTLRPPPQVDSQQLFEGQRELIIQHQGEAYRLRITRHDKLILTK
jgi:hemin uptake protein HemP